MSESICPLCSKPFADCDCPFVHRYGPGPQSPSPAQRRGAKQARLIEAKLALADAVLRDPCAVFVPGLVDRVREAEAALEEGK